MPGAIEKVYKRIDDVELKLYVYQPPGHKQTDSRGGRFLFGGGWKSGTPKQFGTALSAPFPAGWSPFPLIIVSRRGTALWRRIVLPTRSPRFVGFGRIVNRLELIRNGSSRGRFRWRSLGRLHRDD
ncbi:MAG: hypothetical protein R3C05_29205 [Pirellulaceae bacterium]